MADTSRLTDWVLSKSADLGLRVTALQWVNTWLPGFYDYRVRIAVQGKDFIGRGLDADEKTAFDKASAEAIERAMCWTLKAPAAMAAFPDEEGAKRRAYYELVGIDRAVCHHFCRLPFRPASFAALGKSVPVSTIKKMAAASQLEIRLFELRPVTDARVFSAIAWSGDPRHPVKGFVAGFGTGSYQETAALGAILECLRTATAVFIGGACPEEPLNSLKARRSPWWHIWQAQTEESMKHFREYLLPRDQAQAQDWRPEEICINDVTFKRLSTPHTLFDGLPLVVLCAVSQKLIEPQYGDFRLSENSMQRFRAFNGGAVSIDVSVPHFYG